MRKKNASLVPAPSPCHAEALPRLVHPEAKKKEWNHCKGLATGAFLGVILGGSETNFAGELYWRGMTYVLLRGQLLMAEVKWGAGGHTYTKAHCVPG